MGLCHLSPWIGWEVAGGAGGGEGISVATRKPFLTGLAGPSVPAPGPASPASPRGGDGGSWVMGRLSKQKMNFPLLPVCPPPRGEGECCVHNDRPDCDGDSKFSVLTPRTKGSDSSGEFCQSSALWFPAADTGHHPPWTSTREPWSPASRTPPDTAPLHILRDPPDPRALQALGPFTPPAPGSFLFASVFGIIRPPRWLEGQHSEPLWGAQLKTWPRGRTG